MAISANCTNCSDYRCSIDILIWYFVHTFGELTIHRNADDEMPWHVRCFVVATKGKCLACSQAPPPLLPTICFSHCVHIKRQSFPTYFQSTVSRWRKEWAYIVVSCFDLVYRNIDRCPWFVKRAENRETFMRIWMRIVGECLIKYKHMLCRVYKGSTSEPNPFKLIVDVNLIFGQVQ